MSAAAATLVTVRPPAAPLPRYRLLPAKTVPALCIIPAVLKPAPNRAKKTATVHASALPNAAVDARVVTPVKMEAVKKTTLTATAVPAGIVKLKLQEVAKQHLNVVLVVQLLELVIENLFVQMLEPLIEIIQPQYVHYL